jgi:hypothetical protein
MGYIRAFFLSIADVTSDDRNGVDINTKQVSTAQSTYWDFITITCIYSFIMNSEGYSV